MQYIHESTVNASMYVIPGLAEVPEPHANMHLVSNSCCLHITVVNLLVALLSPLYVCFRRSKCCLNLMERVAIGPSTEELSCDLDCHVGMAFSLTKTLVTAAN